MALNQFRGIVKGDGNCGIRCLSLHFFTDDKFHPLFRLLIYNELNINQTDYAVFISGPSEKGTHDLSFSNASSISEHLIQIKKNQNWVNELDIVAASKALDISIRVTKIVNNQTKNFTYYERDSSKECIHLANTTDHYYLELSNKVSISSAKDVISKCTKIIGSLDERTYYSLCHSLNVNLTTMLAECVHFVNIKTLQFQEKLIRKVEKEQQVIKFLYLIYFINNFYILFQVDKYAVSSGATETGKRTKKPLKIVCSITIISYSCLFLLYLIYDV
jgi:hypothetical protein